MDEFGISSYFSTPLGKIVSDENFSEKAISLTSRFIILPESPVPLI